MKIKKSLAILLTAGLLGLSGCNNKEAKWIDGYLTTDAVKERSSYLNDFTIKVKTKEEIYVLKNNNDITDMDTTQYVLRLTEGTHVKFNKNKINRNCINFDDDLIILSK